MTGLIPLRALDGDLPVWPRGTDSILREKHHEDRAGRLSGLHGRFERPAADAHASFVFVNDFLAHPQAEACTRGVLGSEKRLEDPPACGCAHSAAAIGDKDCYSGSVITPRAGAARRHPDVSL